MRNLLLAAALTFPAGLRAEALASGERALARARASSFEGASCATGEDRAAAMASEARRQAGLARETPERRRARRGAELEARVAEMRRSAERLRRPETRAQAQARREAQARGMARSFSSLGRRCS